jgi:ribosomal protein S1
MEVGDIVIFTECSDAQINWGNNDDPNKYLTKGEEYIITLVEIHKSYTKISVDGVSAKKFNSVCFKKI